MEADTDGRIDAVSSNILGYTDEVLRTPLGSKKIFSLRDEIEQDRYYVVLLAYDYRSAGKPGCRGFFGRHASAFLSQEMTLKRHSL